MLKVIKNQNLLYVTISIIVFLIINIVTIYSYIKADYVPGWDGFGHVAFSYVYHTNIFPNLFGYLNIWFNGMPFPNFYPPLFYFTTSFLAFVNDQQLFLTLFKLFNISMLVITVTGFYFLMLEFFKSKDKALFLNIFFIILISTRERFGDLGISIESVFNYGFLPQSFSFIFFIFFLLFFNKENTIKNRLISIFSLLCIALSNIHVLFITIFYILIFLIYLLLNKKYIEFKIKMVDCFMSGLISLFWFFPMLYYYGFSGAKSSNYGGKEFIDVFLILSIILSLATIKIAHKEKDLKMVIISLYIFFISIINYIPLTEFVVSLPLHTKRWVIIPIILTPMLCVYLINKNKILKIISIGFLMYISLVYVSSVQYQNDDGYFTTAIEQEFQPMLDWMVQNKNPDYLINVESAYIDGVSDYWYIHALLGMNNINTTYAILRESSVTSFAFATIRNSISIDQESIGTKVNIVWQNEKGNRFIKQGIDMGITHFLVKSSFANKKLSVNKDVILEKEFKYWNLYKAKKPIEKTTDKNLKVILTYTDFNLKKNTDNKFDITRLAEELIYHNKLDLIFYQSSETDLSKEIDHMASSGIFITQYSYSNIDKAYDNIIKMSKDRPVYLLKKYDNDLFKKIYGELRFNKNIYFFEDNSYDLNTNMYHIYFKYIFNFINKRSEEFKSNNFIYIRQSYFPNPHSEHKQYVATPFYTLESKTEKNDNVFDIIKLGAYISIISLLITIVYFTYIFRKEN